jgi:hypothetical protein
MKFTYFLLIFSTILIDRYSLDIHSTIRSVGLSNSYFLPSDETTTANYDTLSHIYCNGTALLELNIIDDHTSAIFPVLLAISMFLLVALTGSAIYYAVTVPSVRKQTMIRFTVGIIFGSFFCCFVNIFWYLVPDQTYVCQIRQWFSVTGVTITIAAIATRNWNLLQIFLRRKKFFQYETAERDMNILLFLLTIIEVFFFLINIFLFFFFFFFFFFPFFLLFLFYVHL